MVILHEIEQKILQEDLTSQIDGLNTIFNTNNNYRSSSLEVNLSGLLQRKGSLLDYQETGSDEFTFIKAPKLGMTLIVSYVVEN